MVEELVKRTRSFTKVTQGPKETFTDFSQRLISAANRMISDPEVRQILIECLAFENANSECKRVMMPAKARSTPIDECIRQTVDIGSHTYDDILG